MALNLPHSIENDTPADATELQENYAAIQGYINTNLLHRDGSVAIENPLLLPGDPTQDNHAANKGYVDGQDDLKVTVAGDTMTGDLTFAAAMGLLLPSAGSTIGFGSRLGQHINLYSTTYGLGVQTGATYFRTADSGTFRFFHGGTHNATAGQAGTGGVESVSIIETALILPTTQSTNVRAAVTKKYVDDGMALRLLLSGGTMSGPLYLDSPQTVNAAAAVRYDWVQTHYCAVSGDTMTGYLHVGGTPNPATGTDGMTLRTDGALYSLVTTGAGPGSLPNLILGRQGTQPQAEGGVFVRFERLSTAADCGTITISGTGGVSYNETSDYRVKDELGPVADPVERLMALQPKHLRRKDMGVAFDGFIAHEVADVVPNAVTGDKDAEEMQQLDAGKLIPLLVATVQQLVARVAELEAA